MFFYQKQKSALEKQKTWQRRTYKLSQRQRAMEDAISPARRMILEPPFPSLPEALVKLVNRSGFNVSNEEASRFINEGVKNKIHEKPAVKPQQRHITLSSSHQNSAEPEYLSKYRIQLNNPKSLLSKIKRHIDKVGNISRGKLKTLCVTEFGCKNKTSGSISASIKVLEVDGYITVRGKGDSTIIKSMQK